jgi:hypothetical protein
MALYEAGLCLLKLLYVPHHRSAECWNLYQHMLQNQTDICNMEVQLGLGWLFSPPSVVVFALQFQVFFTLQQDNEAYAQHIQQCSPNTQHPKLQGLKISIIRLQFLQWDEEKFISWPKLFQAEHLQCRARAACSAPVLS